MRLRLYGATDTLHKKGATPFLKKEIHFDKKRSYAFIIKEIVVRMTAYQGYAHKHQGAPQCACELQEHGEWWLRTSRREEMPDRPPRTQWHRAKIMDLLPGWWDLRRLTRLTEKAERFLSTSRLKYDAGWSTWLEVKWWLARSWLVPHRGRDCSSIRNGRKCPGRTRTGGCLARQ